MSPQTTIPFPPPDELLTALQSARRLLLTTHISPDGDAVGSLLATAIILHKLGKEPLLVCQDRIPGNFRFLAGVDRVRTSIENTEIDVIIAVDCSDLSRMGDIVLQAYGGLPLLVIDHHVTNDFFGAINWVEPGACSTSEMIHSLALALDVDLDAPLATCLLTGIVTDTRGFRTDATNAQVMRTVVELMEAGAPLSRITERTLDTRPFSLLRLWGRVLETVEMANGIISVENQRSMRSDLDGVVRAEGLASFILGAAEAKIAVVFTELPDNKIECSFRSLPGYDVAEAAFALGGGGHALASGCTVDGPLDEVRERVLTLLRKEVERGER